MDKSTFLTQEGLEKMRHELLELKTVRRREIALRIQEAKELGDLSENAEYVEAKNEQSFVEGRIVELESILKNATIITQGKRTSDIVQVGSSVRVQKDGEEIDYEIVGSNEADPSAGKISNESPLGTAFLGKKVGEVVAVDVPKGTVEYTIVHIR